MPSRSDVFDKSKVILLAAGIKTVQRGYHWPEEAGVPGTVYPLAAYFEEEPSRIEAGNLPYHYEGTFGLHLWLMTREVVDPLGDASLSWKAMDDMFDAILREMEAPFPTVHAQTMAFIPETFEPFYWYREKPLVVAEMKVRYKVNFA